MDQHKRLLRPPEEPDSPAGRLRLIVLLPAALLLLLAAAEICREAGTIRLLYTGAALGGLYLLALLARLLAPQGGRLWLALLFVGAVALRAAFALGWTVWSNGEELTGWNLALELSQDEAAAVQISGAVWGGVCCLLTALIGEKVTGSRLSGLIAGGMLAFCPTLLFSAGVRTVMPLYTALLLAVLWLLITLPGWDRDKTLAVRIGALAAAFFGVWLALGGLQTQFASYASSWAPLDRDEMMHPLLRSYTLGLLLLALWGTLAKVKQAGRRELLPYALLLTGAAAAAVTAANPIANGWVLPLLAIWGAAPARQLAEWTLLMAAPEGGKGRKKAPPLPMPLWVVKLVVSVAVYTVMLALVLIFFTGNGVFIYEAF